MIDSWLSSATRPRNPQPTVTAFTDWIYEWQRFPQGTDVDMSIDRKQRQERGARAHVDIDLFFRRLSSANDPAIGSDPRRWELVYSDATESKTFDSSALRIGVRPLAGTPDVVLRSKLDGSILIIERKTRTTPPWGIRPTSWPDLEAQLWCYSWMDCWCEAPDVILAGEIFHLQGTNHWEGASLTSNQEAHWRRSDWSPRARCYNAFRKYGGTIDHTKIDVLGGSGSSGQ